ILNTDGSINAVIAFDIDYKGSKQATVTTWRPEYIMVDGVQEFRATTIINAEVVHPNLGTFNPFRTDAGTPAERTALRLSLRDFATEELSQGLTGLDQEILITAEQLCSFLASAESRQQAQTHRQGSLNQVRPGVLKRRRPETPPEQLSSEDADIQKNTKIKRGRRGSDYRPSSSYGDSRI
ncbi:hypothetical protein N7454_001535, partial [Penicillium verhagenii]